VFAVPPDPSALRNVMAFSYPERSAVCRLRKRNSVEGRRQRAITVAIDEDNENAAEGIIDAPAREQRCRHFVDRIG
jgi:hypothetical protein